MGSTTPVAIVTGAGRRLGAAMAVALAEDGYDLVVHYRSSSAAAEKVANAVRARGRQARTLAADVRDAAAVRGLFDEVDAAFGRLDLLVNSASVFQRTPWQTLSEADWDLHLDVNLTGPFRFARLATPRLAESGAGLVVNLVDHSAILPWRDYLPHSVSKAGLVALTKALARELAPSVRVNAICPGAVLWPEDYTAARKRTVLRGTALKREGSPDDIVRALRYLVAADYVTGEVLHVDGGRGLS